MVESNEIYERILNLYESSGMSASRLSEKCGVPLTSLNRFLSGETKSPNFYSLCSVILALGGSVDDIIGAETPSIHLGQAESRYVEQLRADLKYERKSKHIWTLLFIAAVAAFVVFLIVDFVNPTIGFIRYQ